MGRPPAFWVDASGVETPVNLALSAMPTRGGSMQEHHLQLLIRHKLETGVLPMNSIPRVWGGPGSGEICDACEVPITKDQWVIEGISLAGGRKPLQLHAECFHLWERERHAMEGATALSPLPLRQAPAPTASA